MSSTLSPLFTWRSAVASRESGLSPTQRHVALTLSLHMSEKGDSCFPSMPTLVDETGLGLSTVREAIRQLAGAGWLERVVSHQRGRTNRYRALVPDAYRQERAVTEETASSELPNRQEPASKPPTSGGEVVIESVSEDASSGDASAPRERDEIWDFLEEQFGDAGMDRRVQAHQKRNKACADLRRMDATVDELRHAVLAWSRQFVGATLTDIALATHFPQLRPSEAKASAEPAAVDPEQRARVQVRRAAGEIPRRLKQGVCPECSVGGGMHTTDCTLVRETPRRAYRQFIEETAANPAFPLDEIGRVIDSWSDIDDTERQHYRDLAEEVRANHEQEAA